MYKEFYGLEDFPFALSPDPRFIVFTPSYNEVLASTFYGLENAKGLIVLTGEVGTGKTTALRWILRRLDSSVLAAYVFNPRLSIDEFYHHVTQLLGIKDWNNKAELLNTMGKVLEERHRRGLRTVLIIDEAHELSDYVLEEIRLLMNFESDNAKHLQIVLTGQPELREKLNQENLRQMNERVALRCKMHALPNTEEVERYITERLLIAGSDEPNIFTPGAIDFIFQCSEGIPRRINNLCDNSMILGFSLREKSIGLKIIEEVAENLELLPRVEIFAHKPNIKNSKFVGSIFTPEAFEELWSNANLSKDRLLAYVPRTVHNNHFHAPVYGIQQGEKSTYNDNSNRNLDFEKTIDDFKVLIDSSILDVLKKIKAKSDLQAINDLAKLEKTQEVVQEAKSRIEAVKEVISMTADISSLGITLIPILQKMFGL